VTAQPARAVSLQGWFLLPIVWLLLVLSTLARLPGRGAPARERRTVPSERPVRY
jgi:hypothetical protein